MPASVLVISAAAPKSRRLVVATKFHRPRTPKAARSAHFDRLIVTHGEVVASSAKEAVRAAWDFLS